MKRFAIVAYVVAVHAALAVVALKPNIANGIQTRLGIADSSRVRFTQNALTQRLDPVVPKGSVIFHGDSITQALPVSVVAERAINFGIGSQDTRQLAEMLANLNSHKAADRVYLNIGTNDIGVGKAGHSAADMADVLAQIPTSVRVIWSGLLPRAGYEKEVVAANQSIAKLCAARPLCTFIDTHATMATAGGSPLPDIYIDGVHPNPKGYGLWIAALKATD